MSHFFKFPVNYRYNRRSYSVDAMDNRTTITTVSVDSSPVFRRVRSQSSDILCCTGVENAESVTHENFGRHGKPVRLSRSRWAKRSRCMYTGAI